MTSLLDSAPAAFLLDAALRGSALILLALGITRLMRRSTAASRHLVWVTALAGVLALPLVSLFGPAWEVLPLPESFRRAATTAAPALPESPAASPSVPPNEAAAPLAGSGAQAPAPSAAAPLSAAAGQPAPADWRLWLLGLWGIGGALLLVRLLYGVARVWWIGRTATEITDESWVSLADTLARRLRLGRIVTLLREDHASVPMTWGVVRPVVLLPASAAAWTPERRTVVLAHELAHVRRWDTLTQWIAHLALVLFWFNPLVWMAARKLREEREHACDDAVLEIGTRPVTYADHLLDIVRQLGAAEGPVAALAMARRSQFEGRLLAILDSAVARGGVSGRAGLLTALAAAVCIVPLAGLRATAAPSAPPASIRGSVEVKPPAGRTADAHDVVLDHAAGGIEETVAALAGQQDQLAAQVAHVPEEKPASTAAALNLVTAAPPDTGRRGDAPGIGQMADALQSDAAKSGFLVDHVDQQGGQYGEIIRAAEKIDSDDSRARVLEAVASRADLGRDDAIALLRATGSMTSDASMRWVLTTAIPRLNLRDAGVRRAFFAALGGFESDTERRFVLTEVLAKGRPDAAVLHDMFVSARAIDSDTEKRFVLTEAAERYPLGGAVRDAYLATVEAIDSDSERSYALNVLLAGPKTAPAASSHPSPPSRPSAPSRASGASPASQPSRPGGTTARQGTSVWSATHEVTGTSNGRPRRVSIQAKDVVIGSSQLDIRTLQPGGSLHVEEQVGDETRVLRGTPGADGRIEWSYRVNGRTRPVDESARSWMLALIRMMVEAK